MEGSTQRSVIYYNKSSTDPFACSPTLQYPNQPLYYGTKTIYDSITYKPAGTYTRNWTIPNITPGEYCVFVEAYNIANAYSRLQKITVVECDAGTQQNCTTGEGCPGIKTCQTNSLWGSCIDSDPEDMCPLILPTANIISPLDNYQFYIGSNIEFKGETTCGHPPCITQWDSNKDLEWHSTEEEFSFSGLKIGDHNISLLVTDRFENKIRDSVILSINPVASDVLRINSFEVIPEQDLTTKSLIQVKANIVNFSLQEKQASAVLVIINAETGQEVFRDETQNPLIPAGNSENITYNIDLSLIEIKEENYKVKLDVTIYPPEQNTSNNHETKIITVRKETKKVNLTEIEVIILPAILLFILLIINKEKINELIRKKTQKQNQKRKKTK